MVELLSPGGAAAQQSGKRASETESTGGRAGKCRAVHLHRQWLVQSKSRVPSIPVF